jgi:hypothetical protein
MIKNSRIKQNLHKKHKHKKESEQMLKMKKKEFQLIHIKINKVIDISVINKNIEVIKKSLRGKKIC